MDTTNNQTKKKSKSTGVFQLLFLLALLSLFVAATPALAGVDFQDTPTDTPTPTETDNPTSTSTSKPPQTEFERPVVIINFYNTDPKSVNAGQDFNLSMQIFNAGQTSARNIVIVFTPGGFLPRNTGGVIAVPNIYPGNRQDLTQTMTAGWELWGQSVSILDMNINYTDNAGNAYAEKFTLSINLNVPNVAAATITPTPTQTPTSSSVNRPQIVITSYETDVDPLEPGSSFLLSLKVNNLGAANAQRVTMIVGGGSSNNIGGTAEPGGISGASGEFTNFAPLGSSNIQSIGDLAVGTELTASQALIVNVTTNPGAYPMKISFSYLTESGLVLTDEQVITLLVYDLPKLDLSFYRDPGPIFTGQANLLPIQLTNLGRKTVILGNMRVSAQNGAFENNVILIGPLDAGGYFTLDATFIPDIPGPIELELSVDYMDDFNQSRQINKTLIIDIQEFFPPEEPIQGEGDPGFPNTELPETFWQKAWRFLMGLLGFNSGVKQPSQVEITPSEEIQPVDSGGNGRPIKGP